MCRYSRLYLVDNPTYYDNEELDLPSLYWNPKLHKCPFKQHYIAGSAKCSTKPLSKLLTFIYWHGTDTQMWQG
jgi:hypothetical protein